jgi:hypothetical protein
MTLEEVLMDGTSSNMSYECCFIALLARTLQGISINMNPLNDLTMRHFLMKKLSLEGMRQ